jgi:hypothetical protein
VRWTDQNGAAYGEDPYGGVGYTQAYAHEYGYAPGHAYGHAPSHAYGDPYGHEYGYAPSHGYGGGAPTDTAPPPWGGAQPAQWTHPAHRTPAAWEDPTAWDSPLSDVLTAELPVVVAGEESQRTAGRPVPEPDTPEGESVRPVFVDSSGRRQRHVLRAARLLVIPAAGYVAVLISTLLGGPSISAPFVPQAGSTHPATPRATAPDSPSGTGHSAESASSTAPHKSSGTAAGSASAPTDRSTATALATAPTATSQPTAAPATTAAPAPGSKGRAVGSSHKPVK